MTLRSILIGTVCAVFISGFGYLNDNVLWLESFNNGHLMPIIVFGFLLLTVLLLNPLLKRLLPQLVFKPAELALIVTITAAASGIPGRAFMEQLTQTLVMPHYWYKVNPGWQTRHLMDFYPQDSLVLDDDYENVVNRFHIGSDSNDDSELSTAQWLRKECSQVPWRQWIPPLKTWLPFIFFTVTAMAAMALVVHHQWASHEHLQYPLATFVSNLVQEDQGRLFNATLRNRLFWIGLVAVLAIRLNNGLHQWFPDVVIPIKLEHSLGAFYELVPSLKRNPWAWGLMRVDIFPLVIAFAFLLSSEISLTLGVSQLLWAVFCCLAVGYGFSMQTDYEIGGWQGWNRTGAYVAFTLMILYSGRFYYGNLLRRACWLPPRHGDHQIAPPKGTVNAMRVFLISTLALCLLSIRLGLPWPIAVLTILLMLVSFFVVARLSAETGLFFIQPGWQPFGAILALFGGFAMGPQAILISALICSVLCVDQSQSLMAYLSNGLKLSDDTRVSPVTLTKATWGTYLLGLAVSLVVVIVCVYQVGTPQVLGWSHWRVPTLPFRAMDPVVLTLQANGSLEESLGLGSWERLLAMRPSPAFACAFSLGFLGVILFAVLRLRCKRWPLHPCLFVVWATYPMTVLSNAFLLGWLFKVLVQKFGGAKCVQSVKPLCYGFIAADILGALIFMIAGAIYFFITDEVPMTYRYFPR